MGGLSVGNEMNLRQTGMGSRLPARSIMSRF